MSELGDGRIVFNGVLLDITDTRETEAKLRQSEAKLREAEAVAHIGNFEFDLASLGGHIRPTRCTACSTKNRRKHEPVPILRALVPDDYAVLFDRLNHTRDSANRTPLNTTPLPDGSYRHLYTIGQVGLLDNMGKTVKVFGTSQDMTERKAAEPNVNDCSRAPKFCTKSAKPSIKSMTKAIW